MITTWKTSYLFYVHLLGTMCILIFRVIIHASHEKKLAVVRATRVVYIICIYRVLPLINSVYCHTDYANIPGILPIGLGVYDLRQSPAINR